MREAMTSQERKIALQKLGHRSSHDVRVEGVRAFEARGDASCTPDLVELLRDPEEAVRFHACTVLGAIGDGRALEELERVGLEDRSNDDRDGPSVAHEAWGAAVKIRARHGVLKRDVDRLMVLLQEGGRWTSMLESALGAIGEPAVDALLRGLEHEAVQVRWRCASCLGRLDSSRRVPGLLRAMRDPEESVRAAAADALVYSRDPRILQPMLAALQEPHWQVRMRAAAALGQLGDERARPALEALQRDPHESVRSNAVSALKRMSTKK
jgi:HEAT repeat protein